MYEAEIIIHSLNYDCWPKKEKKSQSTLKLRILLTLRLLVEKQGWPYRCIYYLTAIFSCAAQRQLMLKKIFNVCAQALDVCCGSVHLNSAQAHPLARYA